jgi:ATP-dependent Clp protease protease subunit
MPYSGEYTCILGTGKYDTYARKNCDEKHDGKCIDVLYGIKDNKSEIESLRYKTDIWTEESARSHCKSRSGTFEKASGQAKTTFSPKNFNHNSTVEDSEPDWGGIDKTALPRNAFADEGEADKKSTWGYPHHWVKDGGGKDENGIYTTGAMYLHKGGLNAAWAAAQGARTGQGASAEVKSHLQTHRNSLGLNDQASFKGYSVKAQASEAEIWIYESIGEGWFWEGLTAKQFAKDITALGDVSKITVRLNSAGGNMFDGVAIYNILKQHKARVVVKIDGLAASIASVIAMAGNEIEIGINAMMMIHQAWGQVVGKAAEMRTAADALDKINEAIASSYLTRSKMGREKITELMEAETWINAEEAIGYGLADKTMESVPVVANFDLSKFNYRNIPEVLAKKAGGPLERSSGLRQKQAAMQIAVQKMRAAGTPGGR